MSIKMYKGPLEGNRPHDDLGEADVYISSDGISLSFKSNTSERRSEFLVDIMPDSFEKLASKMMSCDRGAAIIAFGKALQEYKD